VAHNYFSIQAAKEHSPRLETNLVALEARGNNKRHFSRKCPSGSYYRLSHSKLETQKLANFHGFSIERFVEV